MMLPNVFAKGNKKTQANLVVLRKEAMADKAPRVALRIQGVQLSLEKHRVSEIAQLLKVHRATVHNWIQQWNAWGEEGLLEGHRAGRPASLTQEDWLRLRDIVESGPVAYGLQTGIWTSINLAEIIAEEFGVVYHPGHVRKLLRRIGLSVQRPTTRLIQADPALQRKWTRYTVPNLKKKPLRSTP
jgi:transposase